MFACRDITRYFPCCRGRTIRFGVSVLCCVVDALFAADAAFCVRLHEVRKQSDSEYQKPSFRHIKTSTF